MNDRTPYGVTTSNNCDRHKRGRQHADVPGDQYTLLGFEQVRFAVAAVTLLEDSRHRLDPARIARHRLFALGVLGRFGRRGILGGRFGGRQGQIP